MKMAHSFENDYCDFDENRSVFRFYKNLKHICEKYTDENHVSDVIDMETMEIVTDNGDLAELNAPKKFGHSKLVATKKETDDVNSDEEYQEFLQDPDGYINAPSMPNDPFKDQHAREAFNATYLVKTLDRLEMNNQTLHIKEEVENDPLCRLEETLIENIDSSSSDESSDYLSDEYDSSSSSSCSDEEFFYFRKPPHTNIIAGKGTSPGRSPAKHKESQALFSSPASSKPGAVPRYRRDARKRTPVRPLMVQKSKIQDPTITSNTIGQHLGHEFVTKVPSTFDFTGCDEQLDEKENRFLTLPSASAERQTFQRAAQKAKRRIVPSLLKPISDQNTPPKAAQPKFVVGSHGALSPSTAVTQSLNTLSLKPCLEVQTQEEPIDLSTGGSNDNNQQSHVTNSEKHTGHLKTVRKTLSYPKHMKSLFGVKPSRWKPEEDMVALLGEGSSEDMEDIDECTVDQEKSESLSQQSNSPKESQEMMSQKFGSAHNRVLEDQFLHTPNPANPNCTFVVNAGTEVPQAQSPLFVKPKLMTSPQHARLGSSNIPQRNLQRSSYTSPVAFFKVMQKKAGMKKQTPVSKNILTSKPVQQQGSKARVVRTSSESDDIQFQTDSDRDKNSTPPPSTATTTDGREAPTSTPTKGHQHVKIDLDLSCIPRLIGSTTASAFHSAIPVAANCQQEIPCHKLENTNGASVPMKAAVFPPSQGFVPIVPQSLHRAEAKAKHSEEQEWRKDTCQKDIKLSNEESPSEVQDSTVNDDYDSLRSNNTDSNSDSDESFTVMTPSPRRYSKAKANQSLSSSTKKGISGKSLGHKYVSQHKDRLKSIPAKKGYSLKSPRSNVAKKNYKNWDASTGSSSDSEASFASITGAVDTTKVENSHLQAYSGSNYNPSKLTMSEPRRFLTTRQGASPTGLKGRPQSAYKVKKSSVSKQLHKGAKATVPSQPKSGDSTKKWNWSFTRKQIDPALKESLDVFECKSCSSDSDDDIGIKPTGKLYAQRHSSGSRTGHLGRLKSLPQRQRSSRPMEQSGNSDLDENRPLLNAHRTSQPSVCTGPEKCDKSFCFNCV